MISAWISIQHLTWLWIGSIQKENQTHYQRNANSTTTTSRPEVERPADPAQSGQRLLRMSDQRAQTSQAGQRDQLRRLAHTGHPWVGERGQPQHQWQAGVHLHNHVHHQLGQHKRQSQKEASDEYFPMDEELAGVSGSDCHSHGFQGHGKVCASRRWMRRWI